MSKYDKLAEDIIAAVGGKENVISLRHCVTRLRFRLKDESIAKDEVLKNMDGVITIMKAMGEYMVVIGEHVPDVYAVVCEKLGLTPEEANPVKQEEGQKQGVVQRVLGVIMAAMGPTLNMLCASGLIKGLTTILLFAGVIEATDGVYLLLNAMGDAIFTFLPIMLGFNLAKKLGGDPFLGFLIGAILCYPGINGVDIDLFGYVINATYSGSFLPVILIVAVAVPVEKWLKAHISDLFKGFLAPVITLLVVMPLGFVAIGPFADLIGNYLNLGINGIYGISPLIAGIILAGFWQVFVLFGVHGVIITFPFMNLLQGIPDKIMPLVSFACFAQIGVVLAIYIKTKDQKLKSIALPAFVSGIFGVTEPAIYGVTLPRIKMFVISCVGSAVGGAVIVLTDMTTYMYTGMGIVGAVGTLNPDGPEILPVILAILVPFIFSFVVAFIMYSDDDPVADTGSEKKPEKIVTQENITAPMKGAVKSLTEAPDEAFASESLGKGVIIEPSEGRVVAPFDGTIRTLFPTKHAVGIVSENGCEVLIHIGMNTVRLEGEGFEAHVKQGDKVKKGQVLVTFDLERIQAKGYDCTSPVIVTNTDYYLDFLEVHEPEVAVNEPLLTLVL